MDRSTNSQCRKENENPELCPECSRELTVDEIPRPGRRPLIVKSCWYCGGEVTAIGNGISPMVTVGAIF